MQDLGNLFAFASLAIQPEEGRTHSDDWQQTAHLGQRANFL